MLIWYQSSLLLLKVMKVLIQPADHIEMGSLCHHKGHTDICSQCCCWSWCLRSLLHTRGHTEVSDWSSCLDSWQWSLSMLPLKANMWGPDAVRVWVDWCPWLCYHPRPLRRPWSEALLMLMNRAAAEGQANVSGLCSHLGPGWCPLSVPPCLDLWSWCP